MDKIKVLVTGACGKMGREVVKAVINESELKLVAAVDFLSVGEDIGEIVGIGKKNIFVIQELEKTIKESEPDVLVDFTKADAVINNLKIAVNNKVRCVVGTTGFDEKNLPAEIKKLCAKNKLGVIICPNFAIGAVLMMEFAKVAAKYLPNIEIIELHHDKKKDAPSGTAKRSAEIINKFKNKELEIKICGEENIKGVRGGELDGVRIHSVRLPGLVAHQEIIFGGLGQILTIRHDSLNRESFMPGVILAIKKVVKLKKMVFGLEEIL